jgi:general secretion pathway protein G
MKPRRRRRHGFTLLEILLVLAILVILGGTVTIYFSKTQSKAYAKTAKIQIDGAGQALEQYHIEVGSYPSTQQGLGALSSAPADMTDTTKWDGPYIPKQIPADPWGRPYQYESDGTGFHMWSWGADGQDGTPDDISNI